MNKLTEQEVIEILTKYDTINSMPTLSRLHIFIDNNLYVIETRIRGNWTVNEPLHSIDIYIEDSGQPSFSYPNDCKEQEGYITLIISTNFPSIFKTYKLQEKESKSRRKNYKRK